MVQLYPVIFELFLALKTDTVILLTHGKLINLECRFWRVGFFIGALSLLENDKGRVLLDCLFGRELFAVARNIHSGNYVGFIKYFSILFLDRKRVPTFRKYLTDRLRLLVDTLHIIGRNILGIYV